MKDPTKNALSPEGPESSPSDSIGQALLRRDRFWIMFGILGVTALAWVYTAGLVDPSHGSGLHGPGAHGAHGAASSFPLLLAMWVVMMVAMMLPTASPMILTYASMARRQKEAHQSAGLSVPALVLGYLSAWLVFSVLAAGLDSVLQQAAFVNSEGKSESFFFSGGLLILAGLFQWTPLKTACLARCRSPLALMLMEWREGTFGAFQMGLRHGLFCVGCCWALMGLMWVAGMLNLLWLAALTLYMLAEKVLPGAERWSRWVGAVSVMAGLVLWSLALRAVE